MNDTATLADPQRRARDPEQTRRALLDAAAAAFAANGLAGARTDDIAARTRTTKRMIYYYFGSKEGLYAAVLEEQYGRIRAAEAALDLDALPPEQAMRRLIEATFDHHAANPTFVRLVAAENINEARIVAASPAIRARNQAIMGTMATLLARGVAAGAFRAGVDPFDLHVLINGFCFHRVANRHTLGAIFQRDLTEPALVGRQRAMLADAVLAWLRP